MFIERLTKSDIQEFMGDEYEVLGSVSISHSTCSTAPEIDISIEWKFNGHRSIHVFLDFSSRGLNNPDKWIKYLGNKFGDEYKNAYKAHCMSVFDN